MKKIFALFIWAVFIFYLTTIMLEICGLSLQRIHIIQMSMFPTILNDDNIIIDRKFSSIDRGDIIVFDIGQDSAIKRVIGLPGEKVILIGTVVCIEKNGERKMLEEPYLYKWFEYNHIEVEVPEGYLFVLGDNRDTSYDSRYFGCIPLSSVRGYMLCKI